MYSTNDKKTVGSDKSNNTIFEKKKERKWMSNFLSIMMGLIAFAQATLIVVVAVVICRQFKLTEGRTNAEATQVIVPGVSQVDSTISVDDYHVNSQISERESEAVDSFGISYMTILLSLITLCATLAVVIPYLIGKIYIESQVDKQILEVKASLDKKMNSEDFEDLKTQFKEDLDSMKTEYSDYLDVEIAHNARMISYLLAHSNYTDADSLKVNSWIIGWASKALLRYTSHNYGFYYHMEKFIDNCIDYIIEAGGKISETKCKEEEETSIILRAITDLFDTCTTPKVKKENYSAGIKRKYNELIKILIKLCNCIDNDVVVVDAIYDKSKNRGKVETNDYYKWVSDILEEYKSIDVKR